MASSREQGIATLFRVLDSMSGGWRGLFRQKKEYLSGWYWSLFSNLYREPAPTKVSTACGYMPEVKSVNGMKNYVQRALEEGYLVYVDGKGTEETGALKLDRAIQLAPKFREELEEYLHFCAKQMLSSQSDE